MSLILRSGRHSVAEGSVDDIVKIVKVLKVVRNDDANWIDIKKPWRVIEEVLAASGLNRSCAPKEHNGIDPFSSLSVWSESGKKKLISVWK
jgi:hypothetical protein